MLEDDLKFAKIELNAVKILCPIFVIGACIWYMLKSNDEDKLLCMGILFVIGIAITAFVIARSHAKKLCIERYLVALKDKSFDEALNYGRMYYGLKRNGMKGLSGQGLTIYDEQAISNDISAYSKI